MRDLSDVITSQSDKRQYASFRLENGLTVLMILDPEIHAEGRVQHETAKGACHESSSSVDSSDLEHSSDVCSIIIVSLK